MAREVDLDAVLGEVEEESVTVKFGGQEFTLPPELPLAYTTRVAAGDLEGAVGALLGDDQSARFIAMQPSVRAVKALFEQAHVIYGLAEGESPASQGS